MAVIDFIRTGKWYVWTFGDLKMKPEVASSLVDYEKICQNTWPYKPSTAQKLVDNWLKGITPKKWVIVECLAPAKDFKEVYGGKENKGSILRVYIYGGV